MIVLYISSLGSRFLISSISFLSDFRFPLYTFNYDYFNFIYLRISFVLMTDLNLSIFSSLSYDHWSYSYSGSLDS